jgi:phage terminase large subunit
VINPFLEFKRLYRHDPVRFVRDVLFAEPDEEQQKVMQAVARGDRRVTIKSGHGVGKTTMLAWLIIWFACTRTPFKVVCTAPTSGQLFDALAAETKSWLRKMQPVWTTEIFEIKTDRIEDRTAPDDNFIVFATSRAETPEALAGKHSENLLLIVDEASGVPEPVFEAARGSMAGENRQMILAGNPVRTTGLFFDSHTNLELGWTRFTISCVDHPRIPASYVQEAAQQYGEDSNPFRVRVLGEFPKGEDDVVIPFEWLEAATKRDIARTPGLKPVWGVDVGRFGSDPSALCKRFGRVVPEPIVLFQGIDLMQLVGRIKAEYDSCQPSERPEEILVDVIGLGSGVVDRGRELKLPVRGINVSEAASISDKYLNLRAELWHSKGRTFFERKDCRIADPALAAELSRPKFVYTSSGKIQVESKADMKKRLPRHGSPNRADAFLLTLASETVAAAGMAAGKSWNTPLVRGLKGVY